MVEPALQMDGVPARHQTAILENPQFARSVVACSDDFMEGVFQRDRVIVGSLVLLANRDVGRESVKDAGLTYFYSVFIC